MIKTTALKTTARERYYCPDLAVLFARDSSLSRVSGPALRQQLRLTLRKEGQHLGLALLWRPHGEASPHFDFDVIVSTAYPSPFRPVK